MSDFKARMHQIQFRWGSAPDPAVGAYSASPNPLSACKGPTCKGREGKGGTGGREGVPSTFSFADLRHDDGNLLN